jgi:hypothetical protein
MATDNIKQLGAWAFKTSYHAANIKPLNEHLMLMYKYPWNKLRACLDPLQFLKNFFLKIVSKSWFLKTLGEGVWRPISFFSQKRRRIMFHYIKKKNGARTRYNTPYCFTELRTRLNKQGATTR